MYVCIKIIDDFHIDTFEDMCAWHLATIKSFVDSFFDRIELNFPGFRVDNRPSDIESLKSFVTAGMKVTMSPKFLIDHFSFYKALSNL